MLIFLKLLDKRSFYLEFWSSGIQKLESLNHRPSILSHEIACQSACGSRLASNRVHKNTFCLFWCWFYKIVNLFGCLIIVIKKSLTFWVLPKEREINNSYRFPEIPNLFPRAVYNMRNFISYDKFKILIYFCMEKDLPGQKIRLL